MFKNENNTISQFCRDYLGEAFKIAESQPSIDEYYSELHRRISNKYGLEEGYLMGVDHPFHWFLFFSEKLLEQKYSKKPFLTSRSSLMVCRSAAMMPEGIEERFLNSKDGVCFIKKIEHLG